MTLTDEIVDAATAAYWGTFSSDEVLGMNDADLEEALAMRAALTMTLRRFQDQVDGELVNLEELFRGWSRQTSGKVHEALQDCALEVRRLILANRK